MAIGDIVRSRTQAETLDGLKQIDIQPFIDQIMVRQLPSVPENRSPIIWVAESWLAEGFARAELVKINPEGGVEKNDPVTLAWRSPKHGRGPFCRAVVHDWIDGTFFVRPRFDGAGDIRTFEWMPREHMKTPQPKSMGRKIWHFTPPSSMPTALRSDDFIWGVWDIDPDNDYLGLSPLRKIEGTIRLDAAVTQYVVDAFLNSGGKGLMVTMPVLANPARFKTTEERETYRVKMRDTITQATTGQNRGGALVTDGETEITEYGVNIAEVDVSNFWGHCYEIELGIFQIPPSAAGQRIGRDPTYANSRTWESVAYERGLLPRLRDFASVLEERLLTPSQRTAGFRLEFKTTDADRAALEDQILREKLILDRVEKGVIGIIEAREKLGDLSTPANVELLADLQRAHLIRQYGLTIQVPLASDNLSGFLTEAIDAGVAPAELGESTVAVAAPQARE